MTNAERFIGDEDLIDTFIDEFNEFACSEDIDFKYHYLKETLMRFFKASVKPTLTEDERVILSNIKEFNYIGREEDNDLYVRFRYSEAYTEKHYIDMFRHLFKFIKEGEEYSIEELLK